MGIRLCALPRLLTAPLQPMRVSRVVRARRQVEGVQGKLRITTPPDPGAIVTYLTTEQVAALFRCSTRSARELTRTTRIPHRRVPGQRRCLFVEGEVVAWLNGGELEVRELAHGGRAVAVKESDGGAGGQQHPPPLSLFT